MTRRQPLLVAGLFLGIAAFAATAQGQQLRRYQPNSPTVSPYLNLLRGNTGPVPNYYSLVRPQLNQLDFNRQQLAQQAQQAASLRLLQTEAQKALPLAPTGKSSWFMVPARATFGNTSRFYSQTPTGPRR